MSIEDTINTQIAGINTYLASVAAQTDTLSDSLVALVDDIDSNYRIDYATIGHGDPVIPADIQNVPQAWIDTLSDITGMLVNDDDKPVLDKDQFRSVPDVIIVDTPDVPEIPDFNDFHPPSPGIGYSPTVPNINSPSIPDSPDYVMPDLPTLTDIVIPDVPDFYEPPMFAGVKPEDLSIAEIPQFSFSEEQYISDLETAATSWLENIIANGGTGLGAEVETAIFDRALTRETITARSNIENVSDEFSASGFPRPQGALRARLAEIRSDLQVRTEDLSRNILEEQARLAQNNTQFALTTSIQHEATRLQHHSQIQQRALEHAKATVEMAVAIYDLKVKEYIARWDGYKAEAMVFGELIKATMLEIEKYKAEIEAAIAITQVDKSRVDLYTAQIDGLDSLAKFYSTQMQGAKVAADIEELKLRTFASEIEGYKADLQAKALEYEGFKAVISGETAKADIAKLNIDAYRGINDGIRINVEAQKAQSASILEQNQAKLDIFNGEVDIYKIELMNRSEILRAAATAYMAENESYKASISLARSENEVEQANREISLEASRANVNMLNETYRLQAKLTTDTINAGMTNVTAGIGHYSNIGAAVASQMNTIAQLVSSEDRTAEE